MDDIIMQISSLLLHWHFTKKDMQTFFLFNKKVFKLFLKLQCTHFGKIWNYVYISTWVHYKFQGLES